MQTRRSFMKMLGVIAALPSVLLKGKPSPKVKPATGGVVSKSFITRNWSVYNSKGELVISQKDAEKAMERATKKAVLESHRKALCSIARKTVNQWERTGIVGADEALRLVDEYTRVVNKAFGNINGECLC